MTGKVELQGLRLDTRYKKLREVSGNEFKKVKKFIDSNKNGEGSSGVDISEKTERKYIDSLHMVYKTLNKKLLDLTKEDLTKLKKDLKSGKIKSSFNRPYSNQTIREMQIILIRFLEFFNPEKYSSMKKWFVIKIPKKSIDYLEEKEIEKLYNACKTASQRFLIAVLFDTGARASEFLNIRTEDIIEPTQSFPYYQILFREEYSKTKERKIGLYWKHSTEAVREYLSQIDKSDLKAPVYDKTYDSIRIFINRLGRRVLNKKINFHMFRKSSASFYAMKLKSRQQLCYRYGWNFSSEVPDVYISRNQGEKEVKKEMLNTSMQKLQEENDRLKTKMAMNQKQNEEFRERLKQLEGMLNNLVNKKGKKN